jgi:hypothetical protein
MEQFGSSTAVDREKRSDFVHLRRGIGKNGAILFIYGGGTGKTEQFDSSTAGQRKKTAGFLRGTARRWENPIVESSYA